MSPGKNKAYINLATAQVASNRCDGAELNVEKARKIDSGDLDYLRASMIFERDCNKDNDAARTIQDLIDSKTNSQKF